MADFISVEDVKAYLKIPFDDEDVLLETFVETAKEYVIDYLNHDLEGTKRENLAGLYLVAYWYENRNLISTGNTIPKELPFTVKNLLNQTRSIPL